jgi:ketosteroid isomerase-like protein
VSVSADRSTTEKLLRELYAARLAGQLEALCSLFHNQARFRIAGSSDGKPIAIEASSVEEIHSWLAVMVKTFRLTRHEELSLVVEGGRAAMHWRADIHSRITGSVVSTELVDLIEVRSGLIVSYVEFFVPQ